MERYQLAFCTLDDVVLQLNYDKAATLQLNSGQQALVDNLVANAKELFKQLIFDASDDIMNQWFRFFVPVDAEVTVYASDTAWQDGWEYQAPCYRFNTKFIDYGDLLSLSSVTLGGTAIGASYRRLYPAQNRPYTGVEFDRSAVSFPSTRDFSTSIVINGTWGYHENPSQMWKNIGSLQAGLNDSATSFVATSGTVANFKVYQYLRINSEYLFVTDVDGDSPYTITVERGVNGSTAASHDSADTIEAYQIMPQVAQATRRHVIRLFRKSPEYADLAIVGESAVNLDPENIKLSIGKRLFFGRV